MLFDLRRRMNVISWCININVLWQLPLPSFYLVCKYTHCISMLKLIVFLVVLSLFFYLKHDIVVSFFMCFWFVEWTVWQCPNDNYNLVFYLLFCWLSLLCGLFFLNCYAAKRFVGFVFVLFFAWLVVHFAGVFLVDCVIEEWVSEMNVELSCVFSKFLFFCVEIVLTSYWQTTWSLLVLTLSVTCYLVFFTKQCTCKHHLEKTTRS